jgi:hypothetical protein
VPCRIALGDGPRILAFVVPSVVEADGKGPDRLRRDLRHQRDDDGGIDPAGKKPAQRHIRYETLSHRRRDFLARAREPLGVARGYALGTRLPVALRPHRLAVDDE